LKLNFHLITFVSHVSSSDSIQKSGDLNMQMAMSSKLSSALLWTLDSVGWCVDHHWVTGSPIFNFPRHTCFPVLSGHQVQTARLWWKTEGNIKIYSLLLTVTYFKCHIYTICTIIYDNNVVVEMAYCHLWCKRSNNVTCILSQYLVCWWHKSMKILISLVVHIVL
jgi:hypothetical protein